LADFDRLLTDTTAFQPPDAEEVLRCYAERYGTEAAEHERQRGLSETRVRILAEALRSEQFAASPFAKR
jgi:hypothetical protein